MAASNIRAGNAFVEMSLRDNLSKALDNAKKKVEGFGKSLTSIGKSMLGIGAAITGPLVLAATSFASWGDEITKASQRTGVAAAELQGLKYAAEQSGASFEDLQSGLGKMQKFLYAAASGSDAATETLRQLGLSLSDLQGLSPDEQFKVLSDALAKVGDTTAQAHLGTEVFSKGFATLLPLIEEGSEGMNELAARAEELGLIFSAEDATAATRFGDTLDDLKKQLSAIVFQVGAVVANALQPFADATVAVLSSVIRFIKENRTLVLSVLGVGVGLLAAGAAFVATGLAIQGVIAAAAGISAAFGFIATAIGVILNPVVLVSAALVGLAGYLLYTSEVGQNVVAFLSAKFQELLATSKEVFGGIADALSAGDIGLAAQILWTGLKLLWIQGTQELQNKWSEFKAAFVQTAAAAFYGALELYENVKASLMTAWEDTTSFFGDLWDGFIGTFTSLWDTAVASVAKGLNYLQSLWDDSVDLEAANAAIDEAAARAEAARQQDEIKRKQARDAERDANKNNIESEKQKAIDQINKDEQAISAAADENAKQQIADLEKQRQELQKQLDEMRKKAGDDKAAKDEARLKDAKKPGERDLEDVLSKQTNKTTFKAASTFSLAALDSLKGGIGGTKLEQDTAAIRKAAEQTAKNTKEIVKPTFK